ncbi:hypothetical protein MTO96_025413 [Rhipicephalus appendiculatus]
MGEQAEEIYATFALSEENSKKFDAVVEQFDKYFFPRRNVIFERARFNARVQQDGESAEDFVTAIHPHSKDCEFGALREEIVRDLLVVGIKDKQLFARLQLDPDLTLQKALDSVHQIESVRQQQKSGAPARGAICEQKHSVHKPVGVPQCKGKGELSTRGKQATFSLR